jgi:hypothetical protein
VETEELRQRLENIEKICYSTYELIRKNPTKKYKKRKEKKIIIKPKPEKKWSEKQ